MVSIALLVAAGFGFSSCKDDEPASRPKLSFAETFISVNEDDGDLEVELILDKPHGKDVTIEYTLGGTASDQDAVGTAGADYEINGNHGVVVIRSGQTSGTIDIEIYPDAMFEDDETIEISILDVNTSDIEISADDQVEISIENDDDQLVASFPTTTFTVNEDDGVGVDGSGNPVSVLLQIPVQLDKAAPVDITVEYTIDIDFEKTGKNFAIDSTFAFVNEIPPNYYDYYVKGGSVVASEVGITGKVIVPKGATTGNIDIQVFTDFRFENDETIDITLSATNMVQLGTNKTAIVTLKQQDGKVIALVWSDAHNDVDMDMFLWIGMDTTDLTLWASSIRPGVTPRNETIFIPTLFGDAAFGLSYVYYSGSANPMNFEAQFIDFADGVVEAQADYDVFSGTYTTANLNEWDQQGGTFPPIIAQRFVVDGGVYAYGKLQVPASASRTKKQKVPGHLRRIPGLPLQSPIF